MRFYKINICYSLIKQILSRLKVRPKGIERKILCSLVRNRKKLSCLIISMKIYSLFHLFCFNFLLFFSWFIRLMLLFLLKRIWRIFLLFFYILILFHLFLKNSSILFISTNDDSCCWKFDIKFSGDLWNWISLLNH
jgi:hypothetical protein